MLDYWRYAYTVKSRMHFAKAVLFSWAAGLFAMRQKHYIVLWVYIYKFISIIKPDFGENLSMHKAA